MIQNPYLASTDENNLVEKNETETYFYDNLDFHEPDFLSNLIRRIQPIEARGSWNPAWPFHFPANIHSTIVPIDE